MLPADLYLQPAPLPVHLHAARHAAELLVVVLVRGAQTGEVLHIVQYTVISGAALY